MLLLIGERCSSLRTSRGSRSLGRVVTSQHNLNESIYLQAARVIAQLLVAGGTILFRAGAQAYKQAIVNAGKAGVGKDAASATRMSLDEAQKILGISKEAPLEEVLKRYQHLFDVNAKHSFYLQSKVYRARQRLEEELKQEASKDP